ncbi:hypothetical protein VIGAN_01174900 [Vigna angularis var. angularis]|uniref:Uncharacterized protein n=1 Tax=Vigna angularis var. angularis TaxID=157739 RepID=A0A0S3R0U4_PHAAN|nr:hypothetical protein VIGAN_01174900 [Vigna angularis var. angularis]
MENKDAKDPFKGVDWKAVGGEMQKNPSVQPSLKKRLPNRLRQIPEFYFLPRWPLPKAILFCSACIGAGVAAGMVGEAWIEKKVKGHNVTDIAASMVSSLHVLFSNPHFPELSVSGIKMIHG